MGYIFDALNKQHGDSPEQPDSGDAADNYFDQAFDNAPRGADEPAGDEAATTTHDTAGQAPANGLRIADTLDPGQRGAVADAEQAPASFEAADQAQAEPNPSRNVITTQRGPWWRRLLGSGVSGLDDRLVSLTNPASAVAEEYRAIRTSILARHDNQRHLVHTITSATPQEGKTITCVNLGLSFAELRNRTTVVVECDMRLPTFAKLLGNESAVGLISYLRGEAKLGDIIHELGDSRLFVIPAGGRVSDEAVQLLSSQRMTMLIQSLRAKYDHVIIDTPPVLQLADAGILGAQSDEVLLVARMRRTPRPLVEQAATTLASYNAEVAGIIATDNPRARGRGYGYRYGYGYGYGYTSDRRGKHRKQRHAA